MLPTPIVSAEALLAIYDDVRFLDVRHGPDRVARYEREHLRGAARVDLEADLSGDTAHPERGGRHPLPSLGDFARTLGRLGVTRATPVVLYDESSGALAAARFWWMLRAVGHEHVAVLDGGLEAARRAGLPLDDAPVEPAPMPPYPVGPDWLRPRVDIGEVERLRVDPSWRLVDVRAPERYRGDSEPLDPAAGHIPGARNLPLSDHLDAEGRFLEPEALRALYAARLGDTPLDHTVVSCGSGVTACHTLLALERAGLDGARLYVGSWSEWCRSGHPAATGDEPGA